MPTPKRKAADEAALSREIEIVIHFGKEFKVIQLHRKCIPDVLFSRVMNSFFDTNVQILCASSPCD